MSRKEHRIVTLKPDNKSSSKHNLPKELIPICEEIERLDFVVGCIGKSRWMPKCTNYNNEIKIKGFDDLTKSFCANVYGKSFRQKFFIKVDFPKDWNLLERKCIERALLEHRNSRAGCRAFPSGSCLKE